MFCDRLSWWVLILRGFWWLGSFVLHPCFIRTFVNLCASFPSPFFRTHPPFVVSTSVILADRQLWWWVCSVFVALRSRENRRSWSLGKLCTTPGLNPLGPESFVGSVGHTAGSSRARRYCAAPGIPVDLTGFSFFYFMLSSYIVVKDLCHHNNSTFFGVITKQVSKTSVQLNLATDKLLMCLLL